MLTMPVAAVLSLFFVGMVLWLINGYIPIPAGRIKTVVNVVLGLIVVGIGLWLINTYVPMAGVIKAILNIVVVIATCVGVLQAFGLWEPVVNMWRKIQKPPLDASGARPEACHRAEAASEKPAARSVTEKLHRESRSDRPANGAPVEQNLPATNLPLRKRSPRTLQSLL